MKGTNRMSKQATILKQISDLLGMGVQVRPEIMQELINKCDEQDLLEVFEHALSKVN